MSEMDLVPHVGIGRGHIHLQSQSRLTRVQFSLFHVLKEFQRLFDRSVVIDNTLNVDNVGDCIKKEKNLFLQGLQGSPGELGSANLALAISLETSMSAFVW